MPPPYQLSKLVQNFCARVGNQAAGEFFGVSHHLVERWRSPRSPTRDQIPLEAAQKILDLIYGGEQQKVMARELDGAEVVLFWRGGNNRSTMLCITSLINAWKGTLRMATCLEVGGYEAYNILATRFLLSDAKWALFVDDGIVFSTLGNLSTLNGQWDAQLPEAFGMDILTRLLSHNQPLVSALHFEPRPAGKACFAEAWEDQWCDARAHKESPREELLDTKCFSDQCFLVNRSVFETMSKEIKEVNPLAEHMPYNFFTPSPQLPGDIAFTTRAKAAGIQPKIDMGCMAGRCVQADYAFWGHNTMQALPVKKHV